VTEFTVEREGGVIGGWRAGSGTPALVLHGGPGLTDVTEGLAAELGDGFETIRYQQRGLPPSTQEGPYSVEDHVADALAVLDALGHERAWIVGHSWGGHLAMHIAVTAPERVEALVLVDPLGAVPDGGEADLEAILAERLPEDVAMQVAALDERLMKGEGAEADGQEMLAAVWPYYFAAPDTAPTMPETRMNIQDYSDTWVSVHAHFERGTLVEALPKLDVPTLFIACRESPIPPVWSEKSAALVPGAHIEVVEDCGHFPWLEQPGSIRRALAALR
jgi:pimeloyl-ACP methyl ester carboxylesterase